MQESHNTLEPTCTHSATFNCKMDSFPYSTCDGVPLSLVNVEPARLHNTTVEDIIRNRRVDFANKVVVKNTPKYLERFLSSVLYWPFWLSNVK